jgi:hypothetical protein
MRRTRRINSAMGRLVDTYTHNDLPPQFMGIMETASKAGYDTVVREYQNGYFTLEFDAEQTGLPEIICVTEEIGGSKLQFVPSIDFGTIDKRHYSGNISNLVEQWEDAAKLVDAVSEFTYDPDEEFY